MRRLVIVGARQHAKVVWNILTTSEQTKGKVAVVGFVDDNPALEGTEFMGRPILGKFADLSQIVRKSKIDSAIIGISNRHMRVRRDYFEEVKKRGLQLVNAIHDSALIDGEAKIGSGVVINPLCVVNAYARVGDNVVAYSGVTIEHEDIIGNNVYFGPGVNLTSGVRIGDDTFIGAGVKVVPDVIIGSGVTVGAGAVVLEDIPDNSVAVGAPAKIIRSKVG